MRITFIIAIKELKAFFTSPVGYVVIFIYFLISGWSMVNRMFHYSNRSLQSSQYSQLSAPLNINSDLIQPLLAFGGFLILLLSPAITMKLFSEEKRSGSMELLVTSPVRLTEIILGKFLGAFAFVSVLLLFSFLPVIILFFWSNPDPVATITGIFGIMLFSAAVISFGIFASTLTESQIIAFFIGFGGILFFYIMSWLSVNYYSTIGAVAGYLSLLPHLVNLIRGTPSITDIMYYLSFITLFLYLSYRKLEMARWR